MDSQSTLETEFLNTKNLMSTLDVMKPLLNVYITLIKNRGG